MSVVISYKFDFKPLVKYLNGHIMAEKELKEFKIPSAFITYYFKNVIDKETFIRCYLNDELDMSNPKKIIDFIVDNEDYNFIDFNDHWYYFENDEDMYKVVKEMVNPSKVWKIKYEGYDYNDEYITNDNSVFIQFIINECLDYISKRCIKDPKIEKLYKKLQHFKQNKVWLLYHKSVKKCLKQN